MRRPMLHKSSLVVVALATLAVVRLNVPGFVRDQHDEPVPSKYTAYVTLVHGWPATYLERHVLVGTWAGKSIATAGAGVGADERWAFWRGQDRQLSWRALMLDAAVAYLFVAVVVACWERRRRQRAHVWQLRIAELLLLTAAAAAICGWLAYQRAAWQREQPHLLTLGNTNAPYADQFGAHFSPRLELCAPEWIKRLVGERWLPEFLRRCTWIHVSYESDQAYEGFADAALHLRGLEQLRLISVRSISSRHAVPFADIGELPQVRVLDLASYLDADEAATWQALPDELEKLPPLERLIFPSRRSLRDDSAAVLRELMPKCEIVFADEL
jgi:hypothetical protein